MKKFKITKLLCLMLFSSILALSGCSGNDGTDGAVGAVGAAGAPGSDGTDGSDGAAGADAPTTGAGESCSICHTEGKIADVAVAHPVKTAKPTVSDIVVTSVAGVGDSVTFKVFDGATAVTGLTEDNIKVYMADMVPAGTDTLTTYALTTNPTTVFDTPYFERWLYERTGTNKHNNNLPYPHGAFADNGDGSYTYTFAADLALGGSDAPDFSINDMQRLFIRVDPRDLGLSETIGLLDIMIPADASNSTEVGLTRVIVDNSACTACHNDPLENASHGSHYQSPQACIICHSPIGEFAVGDNVDGIGNGDFMQNSKAFLPSFMHKIHSAIAMDVAPFNTRLKTTAFPDGQGYAGVKFPGDVKNCETCHADKGQDMADAWKTNPTREVCSTCHTTVTFDGSGEYVGLDGTTKSPHPSQADNSICTLCHSANGTASVTDIVTVHAVEKRTMAATITGVTVSDTTGNVAVNFTMDDGGTAVTDPAAFTKMAFTLAQLAPGEGNAANHWVSYTARARTKDPAKAPVIQGYSENTGTLTDDGFGNFTYTFALVNANIDGDIRSNMNDVVNVSSGDSAGIYDATYPNVVIYDPALTHRVGMEFKDANGVRNVTNETFDFVPDGLTALDTREIVTMESCNTCHGGTRLHKGYAVEYCVTCHNQSTFDPYTGNDPQTVDLQRIVHKLHMGSQLPSVKAGGYFAINNADPSNPENHHNFSNLIIPQSVTNCTTCHDESNTNGKNWRENPTSRACITCHDSGPAKSHSILNGGIGN